VQQVSVVFGEALGDDALVADGQEGFFHVCI